MTTAQFRAKTKTVTRRFGWWFLKPGDVVCAVEKTMGLRKGERVQRLGLIQVVSTRQEALNAIAPEDVVREGFPYWQPAQFVEMLMKHYRVAADTPVNRIEYRYLGQQLELPF